MQGEKAAFRPCARTEGALTHHGQTLSLEQIDDISGSRVAAGASLSLPTILTGRSIAAALELPGSGPEGKMRRHLRSKRPKTRGKIEILHTVDERPKRPMRGLTSETGETTHSWQRDPCLCSCLPTGH